MQGNRVFPGITGFSNNVLAGRWGLGRKVAVDNGDTLARREISCPLDELLIREAVQLGFNSRSNFVRSNRGSLEVCVDTYLTGHLPMPLHAKEFIVPLAIPRYYTAVQFAIKYLPCRLINAGIRGNVSDAIMIF